MTIEKLDITDREEMKDWLAEQISDNQHETMLAIGLGNWDESDAAKHIFISMRAEGIGFASPHAGGTVTVDWLTKAINDSFDVDWNPSIGAEYILHAMDRDGVTFREVPKDDFPLSDEQVKALLSDDGAEIDDETYELLYDYYLSSGEMPYGTAKARDGDPHLWIWDQLTHRVSEKA